MNNEEKQAKVDLFLNQAAIWIWIYVIPLIVLSIYPIFNLITTAIIYKMITSTLVEGFTENFQVVTFIIVSYLIYPVALLIIDVIPLFFLKKAVNKKLYLILSAIFLASFLISFVICLINRVIIPLK